MVAGNKKIGILTFHAAHNNGSMLQALALLNIISKRYGYNVEIIDFSNQKQRNMYSIIPRPIRPRQILKNIIWITNYMQIKKQYCMFGAFSNKYMVLSSNNYKERSDFIEYVDEYDAIIVGSDQIWNVKCIDSDDTYYLNFQTNIIKLAYAISFGANNPFEIDSKYKKYVEQFKLISVRENNAKRWIKNGVGIDVEVCLDPTMLLDAGDWEKLVAIGDRIIREDYIFYYCFSITERIQKFLRDVSKKYDMPVYFLDAKEWTLKSCWRNKIRLVKQYGPDVYMNVVKYASLFLTTSFHGTAFATIYKKVFWYINDGNNNPERDDRAITFLAQLSLMDRYKTIEELEEINLKRIPDFSECEENLSELRETSFDYMDKMMKEIENDE